MSLLRDLFDLFRSEPDHPATRNPKSKPATRKPARRQKTIVHPIVGEVTLSQSRRARRISLCVRPSGPVRLSYPYGVSTARALEFLESRIEWIQTARDRIAERLAHSIVNFYSIGPVTPQLLVEEFFFTPDQPVEQRMEAGGMVVVDGVAEFVEDDEVAQMFGQRHQVQAQRQVVAPVAGAPFGAGGPDRYRTVLQTGSHCEFRYAGR